MFGKGTGAVSLQISPSVQVQLLEFQLVDANSGQILSSWAQVGPGPFPAVSQNIVLQLPANAEWYLLQFRAEQDPTSVVGTNNPIAVGEVIAAGGQSLAADLLGNDGKRRQHDTSLAWNSTKSVYCVPGQLGQSSTVRFASSCHDTMVHPVRCGTVYL